VVVDEIRASGGEAVANGASVTDFAEVEAMVADAVARWGRVDILVNNAGILRERSFGKTSLEDFRAVVDVHFWGSVHCSKAVWDVMRGQKYGRIVMTTSSSGLYGNFGQSAYGSAKMALVGLMNTLHEEGERYNIRVSCLAPSAATRMTEGIFPTEQLEMMSPIAVSYGVLALVCDQAPSRVVLCAGAGAFERAHVTLTKGVFIGVSEDAGERVLAALPEISDRIGETVPSNGMVQYQREVESLKRALVCPNSGTDSRSDTQTTILLSS